MIINILKSRATLYRESLSAIKLCERNWRYQDESLNPKSSLEKQE